jgi:hypothetical protein
VIATGEVDPERRNQQFENIAQLRSRYALLKWPALSVDTKKKEFLGGLYRDGKLYTHDGKPLKRFDHDFPHLAEGKVVPHGIYDLEDNSGFVTVGTSAETPAFVVECIGRWWNFRGRFDYPKCGRVLLLMDCGGANSSRGVQFKHDLLKLAARTGLTFTIAHFPPYCSKWNPIEHRLFPHVTRSLQGVYLESPEMVSHRIAQNATTETGLITRSYVLDKKFEKGVKETVPLPDGYPLVRSKELPEWNYTCYPSNYYEHLN